MAFVWLIGLSRQRGLLLLAGAQGGACWAERTYEHQQHPASFNRRYRMHSCNMAALSSHTMEGGETALICHCHSSGPLHTSPFYKWERIRCELVAILSFFPNDGNVNGIVEQHATYFKANNLHSPITGVLVNRWSQEIFFCLSFLKIIIWYFYIVYKHYFKYLLCTMTI